MTYISLICIQETPISKEEGRGVCVKGGGGVCEGVAREGKELRQVGLLEL